MASSSGFGLGTILILASPVSVFRSAFRLSVRPNCFRKQHINIVLLNWRGKHMAGKRSLSLQKLIEPDIKGSFKKLRMNGDWNVHGYRQSLADAIHTIVALILNGGIPPSAEVNNVIRRRYCQTDACGLRRKNQHVEPPSRFLKSINNLLTPMTGHLSIYYGGLRAKVENSSHGGREEFLNCPVLDENDGLFVLLFDTLQDVKDLGETG